MNLSWKLLPLALFAALALVALVPGGGAKPSPVNADFDCATDFQLTVDIVDNAAGGDLILAAGSVVSISPDPQDNVGVRNYTDNGANDDSGTTGRIIENAGCSADGGSQYTITLESLPAGVTCADDTASVMTDLDADTSVDLEVDDCEYSATPTVTPGTLTPTPTGTVTGGASLVLTVYPTTPVCNSTVIVSAIVKDAGSVPINGVPVTFSAPSGSFQNNVVVTVSGVASTFYTPPVSGNVIVNITAAATGFALADTKPVTVTCAAATPTATTPAPVSPSTVRPPSTGDGGLIEGRSWALYGGFVILAGVTFTAALVLARRRA